MRYRDKHYFQFFIC